MPLRLGIATSRLAWFRPRSLTAHRERRFNTGLLRSFDLFWDGADNLGIINQSGSTIFTAGYNGDGLRVSKQDLAGGSFPTQHNYSWGLGGLL